MEKDTVRDFSINRKSYLENELEKSKSFENDLIG